MAVARRPEAYTQSAFVLLAGSSIINGTALGRLGSSSGDSAPVISTLVGWLTVAQTGLEAVVIIAVDLGFNEDM